ncbi:MAG TPA: heavy metal-associated domain-containing protein [Flavobacteriales bacterium]
MKRSLPLVLLVLASCAQAPEAAQEAASSVATTVKEVVITEGVPVTTADIAITGMTCEMMCGGSIKKALAKLPGVSSTEIAFQEGEEAVDRALVTYDPAKVNEAQLVSTIQALHEGQYKVVTVDITKQVKSAGSTTERGRANEESEVAASIGEVAVPSIVGLLYRLVRP